MPARISTAPKAARPMPISAVLDTNVLISGLLVAEGHAARLLDAWSDERFTLVTSLYQIEEVLHVLAYPRIARRLSLNETELTTFVQSLLTHTRLTPGNLRLPGATRDAKDDAIVACAVEGGAQFIISGDQDLLVLEAYEGVVVLTPRQFLDYLEHLRDTPA